MGKSLFPGAGAFPHNTIDSSISATRQSASPACLVQLRPLHDHGGHVPGSAPDDRMAENSALPPVVDRWTFRNNRKKQLDQPDLLPSQRHVKARAIIMVGRVATLPNSKMF